MTFYRRKTFEKTFIHQRPSRGLSWREGLTEVIYREKTLQSSSIHRELSGGLSKREDLREVFCKESRSLGGLLYTKGLSEIFYR